VSCDSNAQCVRDAPNTTESPRRTVTDILSSPTPTITTHKHTICCTAPDRNTVTLTPRHPNSRSNASVALSEMPSMAPDSRNVPPRRPKKYSSYACWSSGGPWACKPDATTCTRAEYRTSKHTCAPAHPHTRTPAHPHTRTPAHPHTRTPAHPHTRTPAHPHTRTPAHPHTRTHVCARQGL
jgi:hypothetical protein